MADREEVAQRRRRMRLAVDALVLLGLLTGLSLFPVVRPRTDPAAPADAVIVLSGDYGERLALASSLVERRLVPTLVFVGTPDGLTEEELCQSRTRVEYLCLHPDPDSTRAEARAVSRLVESRRWRRVVVVTSRFHVTRSRLVFGRCLDAEVAVMGGDPAHGGTLLARQITWEWLKTVYTVAAGPAC